MDRKNDWIIAGSVIAGFLGLGLVTHLLGQPLPPVPPERLAGPVGRYQVVRATPDTIILLDTITGDLYSALPRDIKPHRSRPGSQPPRPRWVPEDKIPFKDERPPKDGERRPPEQPKRAVKGRSATTITGTVTFDGDLADLAHEVKMLDADLLRKIIAVPSEKGMCLAGSEREKTAYQWRVNKKNKGVKNVFVWIRPLNEDDYFDVSDLVKKGEGFDKEIKLDQPHCAFIPHAFLLFQRYVDPSDPDKAPTKQPKTGQKFVVVSSAKRVHNTKWEGKGVIRGGNEIFRPEEEKPIDDFKASYEGPVIFACSIHPWMKAYAWSFDHPFAAVSDENGKYEIKNVPAGVKVRMVAWHEEAGFLNGGRMGEPFEIKDTGVTKDFKVKK